MNFINQFILILLLVFLTGCSKEIVKESVINEINLDASKFISLITDSFTISFEHPVKKTSNNINMN
mgnify:CR=1 FL=1